MNKAQTDSEEPSYAQKPRVCVTQIDYLVVHQKRHNIVRVCVCFECFSFIYFLNVTVSSVYISNFFTLFCLFYKCFAILYSTWCIFDDL